jgi:hypothetical protein
MLRKPPGRVIAIDSAAQFGADPELPPPTASGKKPFYGNRHTIRGVEIMFRRWSNVASAHHKIPIRIVEQIVIEEIYRKAA